jgi:hypothetical protein
LAAEVSLMPPSTSKRARIVGDHPHRGSAVTVRDDLPMLQGMWKVEFGNDNPLADAAYAAPENLRPLPASLPHGSSDVQAAAPSCGDEVLHAVNSSQTNINAPYGGPLPDTPVPLDEVVRPGECHCGCGGDAPVAPVTNSHWGWVRGEPKRFIHGHNGRMRSRRRDFTVEDRGYETPCHIWGGYIAPNGYGRATRADGTKSTAHRVVYGEAHGPLPGGMEPDHLCRVRSCVRLDHLEAVTRSENIRRGDRW